MATSQQQQSINAGAVAVTGTNASLLTAGARSIRHGQRLAARQGYVPVTDLPWLEELRARHDEIAVRFAEAIQVPDKLRSAHAAEIAEWNADVREAARVDTSPPLWDARLSTAWLAGRVDAAEAVIAGIVEELLCVLREIDAGFAEHGIDALIETVEDGFGGAAVVLGRKLRGEAAPPPLPDWADSVWSWRQGRWELQAELEEYTSNRRDQRGRYEDR